MTRILFLLIPVLSFGQNIPKSSTNIIIENDLTALENFNLIAKILLNNDYNIKDSNKDFYTIITEAKYHKKKIRGVQYRLSFVAMNNQIKINSRFLMPGSDWRTSTYKGMRNSPSRYTFEIMNEFSDKISNKKRYY